MSDYLVYGDEMWKPFEEFYFTGQPQAFTLNPGRYLFELNGAKSGRLRHFDHGSYVDPDEDTFIYTSDASIGGTAYGIMNLDHPQNFYAVVGGDGESSRKRTLHPRQPAGGYNGGGNGGLHRDFEDDFDMMSGTAGGGATDIRLSTDEEYTVPDKTCSVPEGYDQVSYIATNMTQFIDLDYKYKENTTVEAMISWFGSIANSDPLMVAFGNRTDSNNKFGMALHLSSSNQYPYYMYPGIETTVKTTRFPSDADSAGLARYRYKVYMADKLVQVKNIYDVSWQRTSGSSSKVQTCDRSMYLFAYNNVDTTNVHKSRMTLYSFKIYEDHKIVRWYVPYSKSISNSTSIDVSGVTWTQGYYNGTTIVTDDYNVTTSLIPFNVENNRIKIHFVPGTKKHITFVTHYFDENQTYLGADNFSNSAIEEADGYIGDVCTSSPFPDAAYVMIGCYCSEKVTPSDITEFALWDVEYDGGYEAGIFDLVNGAKYPCTVGDKLRCGGAEPVKTTYRTNTENTQYIKTVFRRTYNDNSVIQMDYLLFYDKDDNELTVASVTAQYEDGTAPVYTAGIENICVNDTNKVCITNWKQEDGPDLEVVYTLETPIDSKLIDHYVIQTANDYAKRDPAEWEVYVSSDGISWNHLYRQNWYSLPSARHEPTTFTTPQLLPSEPINLAMLSRIIVAPGAGGQPGDYAGPVYYRTRWNECGFGGGPYGSWCSTSYNDWETNDSKNIGKMANQTSGYEFGKGQDAEDRVGWAESEEEYEYSNRNGHGGGGGGWFGGYAAINSRSCVESRDPGIKPSWGGSGSAYVLTQDSYRPDWYMFPFLDVLPTLYFSKPLMLPMRALDGAGIKIYRALNEGETPQPHDKIIIPYTGTKQTFELTKGTYKLKCWGGGNAHFNTGEGNENINKPGYSEGVLNLKQDARLYAYVGSSAAIAGLATTSENKDLISNGTVIFNATSPNYSGRANGVTTGGGSTDIRIGTDSLYARAIVAGGSGGGDADTHGRGPGHGGGLEAGPATYIETGTSPQPATQTNSPTGGSSTVNGGFGYAGPGTRPSSSAKYGGSGGNGWFGSSGVANSSSNEKITAAPGGSGYILTEYSYKPSGYLLGEEYYLSSAYTETGGNTTKLVYTDIEIDVLDVGLTCYVIAHDSEGYKEYDTANDTWTLLSVETLEPGTFDVHGVEVSDVLSDNGLLSSYKIYGYDKYGIGPTELTLNVLPFEQHAITTEYTRAEILSQLYDADQDEETEIFVGYNVKGIEENRRAIIDISCDMLEVPKTDNSVYSIQFSIRNKPDSYYYPTPPEKHIPKVSAMKTGNGFDIPRAYKSYMHGFCKDQSGYEVAVESVLSSTAVEHRRYIYVACVINNLWIRFSRFNLIENTYETIRDVPKSIFTYGSTNAFGGSLLVDDANMYYTSSFRGNVIRILRVPLDGTSYQLHTAPNNSDYYGNAFGKMLWYDDHTIMVNSKNGLVTFNTHSYNYQTYPGGGAIDNMSFMICKHNIYTFQQNANPTIRRFDRETKAYQGTVSMAEGSFVANGCPGQDDIFYITRCSVINVYRDRKNDAPEFIKTIPAPWTATEIANIEYTDGLIYATMISLAMLYMYDIASNKYFAFRMPFTLGSNDSNSTYQHRPATFKGFYFIADMKMLTVNFRKYSKYKIGQKSHDILIRTNSSHTNPWEYDERFCTIDETGVHFHTGDMSYPLTVYDQENHIYVTDNIVRGEDFRQLLGMRCEIPREEEEHNG